MYGIFALINLKLEQFYHRNNQISDYIYEFYLAPVHFKSIQAKSLLKSQIDELVGGLECLIT